MPLGTAMPVLESWLGERSQSYAYLSPTGLSVGAIPASEFRFQDWFQANCRLPVLLCVYQGKGSGRKNRPASPLRARSVILLEVFLLQEMPNK